MPETANDVFMDRINHEAMKRFMAVERIPLKRRPFRNRCFWCDRVMRTAMCVGPYLCPPHYRECQQSLEGYGRREERRKIMVNVLTYQQYPLRTCRTLHHCALCKLSITVGQQYYDGGYARRAHRRCVDIEEMSVPTSMDGGGVNRGGSTGRHPSLDDYDRK
jgi:hypothetical protein